MAFEIKFNGAPNISGNIIVDGKELIRFQKFVKWDVLELTSPQMTAYIQRLIDNPTCDVRDCGVKHLGWYFVDSRVKKYLANTDHGIHLYYGFSVTQLRDNADLNRSDKVIPAPKGW